MVGIIYFYLNIIINLYILIVVYYYSIKTYGIKVTFITNLCPSSLVLTLIFTGTYSMANLGRDLDFVHEVFLISDSITIFTVFIVDFELARSSLKKTKGTYLSIKDIIIISIVVTFYGIFFQLLLDPTAAALGIYFYQNSPPINIFGFPI